MWCGANCGICNMALRFWNIHTSDVFDQRKVVDKRVAARCVTQPRASCAESTRAGPVHQGDDAGSELRGALEAMGARRAAAAADGNRWPTLLGVHMTRADSFRRRTRRAARRGRYTRRAQRCRMRCRPAANHRSSTASGGRCGCGTALRHARVGKRRGQVWRRVCVCVCA